MGFIRLIFASVFTEIYVRKLSKKVIRVLLSQIESFFSITSCINDKPLFLKPFLNKRNNFWIVFND